MCDRALFTVYKQKHEFAPTIKPQVFNMPAKERTPTDNGKADTNKQMIHNYW